MKKIFYCIAMLAFVAVACNKVEINPSQGGDELSPVEKKMITEIVSGNRGSSTKATIADDASFAWTAGDNIAVHVSNGTSGKYVFTSDTGASGANVDDTDPSTASFTVVYEDEYSRDAFAIYPCSIVAADAPNYGQSGTSLDITLPGSYKLAEVSGTTTPCPMIAINKPDSNWDFYQLCGLLRLTMNGIPPSAKRLEIDFNGNKVCGDFSIDSPTPGTSAIATTAGDTHDVITIIKDGDDVTLNNDAWLDGLVLNIPLPVGEYTNITITAYDALTDGNIILTTTRPFAYSASNQRGIKRTVSFPSPMKAFRGYEVSTGILERSVVGTDPATYSLTSGEMVLTTDPESGNEIYALPDGCNPFEPAVNYNNSSAVGKYFNKWMLLRDELGAVENGNNINATSEKLPAGWQFPSGKDDHSDWGEIIMYGAPKSTITVNGTPIKKDNSNRYCPFAMVNVTLTADNGYSVAAGTYYGMFLFRDGSTIPEGYFNTIGRGSKYADNSLTETQFNDLVRMGCLFISATGYYSDSYGWRDLTNSYQEAHYWSNTYNTDSSYYYLKFNENANSASVTTMNGNSTGHREYHVVKLVKPCNP